MNWLAKENIKYLSERNTPYKVLVLENSKSHPYLELLETNQKFALKTIYHFDNLNKTDLSMFNTVLIEISTIPEVNSETFELLNINSNLFFFMV